ncbi:MAG: trypsin-like peptidase domain-containing protein [Isosphaeraceae bacterium]
MSRATSPLLLYAMLATGIALGLALDRVSPRLSAQSTALPGATEPPPTTVEPVGPRSEKEHGEDAVYRKLATQYEQFEHVNRTFELVSKVVSPAVVHIVARKTGRRDNGRAFLYEETGSGVIVRAEKDRAIYVLTNNHVVEGALARDIQIALQDGRVLHPERTHADPSTDVAVLKLDRDDLPAARLGDSDDARVGTWVLALGSPFGLTQSVTQGIISARMRHEDELADNGNINQEYLQTDAAINPGNSGGPLINLKGEVIGINTAIASNGGGSEGVGFSIPINLARWAMDQLVANGKVIRGAMGVHLDALELQAALDAGLDRPRGAVIASVLRGSPADQAGLFPGDIIIHYNHADVLDANQLINLIAKTRIGDFAEIDVLRGGHPVVTKVEIIDRELVMAKEPTEPVPARGTGPLRRAPRPSPYGDGPAAALGLDLVTLDALSARRLGLPETLRGVAVARVEPGSPLATAVQPLDVIGSVGGRLVTTAEEAVRALSRRESRGSVELGLQRPIGGRLKPLTVRVP